MIQEKLQALSVQCALFKFSIDETIQLLDVLAGLPVNEETVKLTVRLSAYRDAYSMFHGGISNRNKRRGTKPKNAHRFKNKTKFHY